MSGRARDRSKGDEETRGRPQLRGSGKRKPDENGTPAEDQRQKRGRSRDSDEMNPAAAKRRFVGCILIRDPLFPQRNCLFSLVIS